MPGAGFDQVNELREHGAGSATPPSPFTPTGRRIPSP